MYRKLVTRYRLSVTARRRNISRLCHFTKIEYLSGIFADRNIWSVERAKQRGSPISRNDTKRFDNRLDAVSVSVQYPNLYVLDSYRPKEGEGWVILFLNVRLLSQYNTEFSPVNAARKRGDYIGKGIKGFKDMFELRIEQCTVHKPCERSSTHLKNCPTCLQAEVLIKGSISTDRLDLIATINNRDHQRVKQVIGRSNHPQIRVEVIPELFNKEQVMNCISQGREI